MKGPLRILIVEDISSDAEMMTFELRQAKIAYTAKCVEDKKSFLRALEEFNPEVILSDFSLPGFSGLEALALAREKIPEVPFILVSGAMGEERAVKTLKSGATDYVLKDRLSRLGPAILRALEEVAVRQERRQAEEALRGSERDYRILVKSLPAVVYKGYLDWTVDFFDDKIEEMTGYRKADFDNRSLKWYQIVLPEDLEGAKQAFRQGLQDSKSYVREYRIKGSQGQVRWIQDRGQIICRDNETVDYISGVFFDITAQKQVEDNTRRQSIILDGINRILREALTCETEEELGRTSLAVLEELTASKFGFITELSPLRTLESLAISDPGWAACRMSPREARRILKHRQVRGLYRRTYEEGQSLIANDPASHPDRIGVPAGHPEITAFLGVPLKHGGKFVGLIGLGNKEGGYSKDDQELVETLSGAIMEALLRKRAEKEVRDSEQKLHFLASQILTAQERERKRVSMELHDELGQGLTVLKLQLRNMEKEMLAEQKDLKEECRHLLGYLDEVIENVRRLSWDLSPTILEDLGLTSALHHLINEFSRHYAVSCSGDLEELDNLFSKDEQIIIYRIFQESLTNILKHAGATRVAITVQQQEGHLTFMLEDNGVGFDPDRVRDRGTPGKGMGLAALHERARMLDGTLQIWSREGGGTRITCRVPVGQKEKGLPQRGPKDG